MIPAADCGPDFFAPHLGSVFRLEAPAGPAEPLTLDEVVPLPRRAGAPREPFTLLFRAASGALHPQRLYTLHHEVLGALELFLVPLGPDARGMRYEAVFN